MKFQHPLTIPISHAVAAFGIYLITLSPTVNFIDSGELVTVSWSLGIAHPTGYPLFTILGRLFTLIPLGTVACRVNLLSAACGATAVFFVSLTVLTVLREHKLFIRAAAATLSASLIACSKTFWDVATQAEVYTLTVLLSSIILYAVLTGWGREGGRSVLLTAYLMGLSFGNHMMVVLLVPSIVYVAVSTRNLHPWKQPSFILRVLALFLLGLSLYLYLPVRSSLGPLLDWGEPESLDRFIAHVSGWQYRVWMFTRSAGELTSRALEFGPRLVHELGAPGTAFCAIGFVGTLVSGGRTFGILLLYLLSALFYAINYDIPDIDPYYLPAILSMALMTGTGVAPLLRTLTGRFGRSPARAGALVLLIITLAGLVSNLDDVDKSRNRLAYYYGYNLLNSLDRGALVITKSWDIYSPVMYLQNVEGIRTDVLVIDFELMRRSWYVGDLVEREERLTERTITVMKRFIDAVGPFERGDSYDAETLERLFTGMFNALIDDTVPGSGAYVDFLDEPAVAPGYLRVPHLMTYRLSREGDISVPAYGTLVLDGVTDPRVPKEDRTENLLDRYWVIAINRGAFLIESGDPEGAADAFSFALSIDPGNDAAKRGLALAEREIDR